MQCVGKTTSPPSTIYLWYKILISLLVHTARNVLFTRHNNKFAAAHAYSYTGSRILISLRVCPRATVDRNRVVIMIGLVFSLYFYMLYNSIIEYPACDQTWDPPVIPTRGFFNGGTREAWVDRRADGDTSNSKT
jgi:hypothetical protein